MGVLSSTQKDAENDGNLRYVTRAWRLLAAESVGQSARLHRGKAWSLEDFDDFFDELALSWGKLDVLLAPAQPRVHARMNCRGRQRSEPLDDSTKLASPQEHRVILHIIDGHASTQYPVRP